MSVIIRTRCPICHAPVRAEIDTDWHGRMVETHERHDCVPVSAPEPEPVPLKEHKKGEPGQCERCGVEVPCTIRRNGRPSVPPKFCPPCRMDYNTEKARERRYAGSGTPVPPEATWKARTCCCRICGEPAEGQSWYCSTHRAERAESQRVALRERRRGQQARYRQREKEEEQ